MLALWKKLSVELTGPFLTALLLSAGFLGFVAWDQSHWWATKADYSFGWLVPAFVAFVIYDRWPRILAAGKACMTAGSPRAAGAQKWALRILVGAVLVLGVGFFLLGAVYRAAAGATHQGTLAISAGAAGIFLSLLFLNAPASAAPKPGGGVFSDARVQLVRWFIFPALVWLVSAPMVSIVEYNLNQFLLSKVVTVVAFVFDLLGLPIEQRGNVLALPLGNVGVEEACSGIRSLTACLFAGSFLSAVFLEKLWKKITLVVAAMALAFVTNLGRSLFLTAWAYRNGPQAIEGKVHDVAGYSVLGLTVIGLLCLLPLLNLQFNVGPGSARKVPGPSGM